MANVPLRPPGVKFFGVFLTPWSSGDLRLNYTTWQPSVDWFPQIDAVQSLGANFIVYFGLADLVANGTIPLATYLARRRQLAEYIASKGMYALSYGTNTFSSQAPGVNNSILNSTLAADASLCASFPNHVGYVCLDEWLASSVDFGGALSNASMVTLLAAQYAACKAAVPAGFAIAATSNPSTQSGNDAFSYAGPSAARCDSVAPYCDFFAVHPFYTVTLAESAAMRAAYPGKEIILPSSVANTQTDTSGDIAARAASVMGLVGSNGFRGMGYWLVADFLAPPDTWGMFSGGGSNPAVLTERPLKTAAFRAGNTAIDIKNRRSIAGKARLNQFKQQGNA